VKDASSIAEEVKDIIKKEDREERRRYTKKVKKEKKEKIIRGITAVVEDRKGKGVIPLIFTRKR